MYDHILVAVDGSDTSIPALRESISLAKSLSSKLHLIHVIDLSMANSAVESPNVFKWRDNLRAEGQKVIAECSEALCETGVEFDTALVVIETPGQHTYDAIEAEAERRNADLIILGTHGRRGVRRLLLGSVAEEVVRIATKPVLLIRGE